MSGEQEHQDNLPPGLSDPNEPNAHVEQDTGGEQRQQQERPTARPKPTLYPDDARAQIFARFRKHRGEEGEPNEAIKLGLPDLTPNEDPGDDEQETGEAETAQEQPVARTEAPATDRIKFKANGRDLDVTLDQLYQMAEITDEEAKSLPLTKIIRSAQMLEASRERLNSARDAANTRQVASPAPAATTETAPQSDEGQTSQDDLIEQLQIGDPKEAKPLLDKYVDQKIDKAFSAKQAAQKSQDWGERVSSSLKTFQTENADLLTDPDAADFVLAKATAGMVDALVAAGAQPDQVVALRANPQLASDAYVQIAALPGVKLKPPEEILAEAAAKTRTIFQRPKAPVTPTPKPNGLAIQDRIAGKRALAQPPARASTDTSAAATRPGYDNRQSAVNKMRVARGQSPIL